MHAGGLQLADLGYPSHHSAVRPRRIHLRARGISVLSLGDGSGVMGSAELNTNI